MTLAQFAANPLVPPKNSRKSHIVYQDLKRRILLGLLTDDSPITEQALALEFSCSQSTVREALLCLQECGLVERRGYQGTYVTRTSLEEAVIMVRLRVSLECAAVGGTVASMTKEAMAALRDLVRLCDDSRARRDVFACSEIDRALHMALFRIAGMPLLEPILERTLLQLHRYLVSPHQGVIPWTVHAGSSHADILDAMEDGDAARARTLLKRHIHLTVQNLAPDIHDTAFEGDAPFEPPLHIPTTAWASAARL